MKRALLILLAVFLSLACSVGQLLPAAVFDAKLAKLFGLDALR